VDTEFVVPIGGEHKEAAVPTPRSPDGVRYERPRDRLLYPRSPFAGPVAGIFFWHLLRIPLNFGANGPRERAALKHFW